MIERTRDEQGFALVIGLMVAMIVLILSVTIVTLSIQSVQSSHYDRRRLFAVGAAEAGVDQYYLHIATTKPSQFQCWQTGTVTTGPTQGVWTATMSVYAGNSPGATPISSAATQSSPNCNLPSSLPSTLYAKISSKGQAPSGTLLRNMESYVRLTPTYGGFGAAVLSTSSTTIANKLTIEGASGNDGDLYVSCPSSPCSLTMNNNQTISGNVYVMGSVSLSNSVTIAGDLWAKGNVTLSNSARVKGNAISSTGSISVSNPALVEGNATAATTATSASQIGGIIITGVTSPDPPSYALPQITFSSAEQAAWTSVGYQINTISGGSASTICSNAKSFIQNPTPNAAGNYKWVVRIPATCQLTFSNNETINLRGHMAIITDGSIVMQNHVTWQAATADLSEVSLFLVARYRTGLTCSGGNYDVTTSQLTEFLNVAEPPELSVFLYSPCAVNMANQTIFNGQVMANTVNVSNQSTLNYQPSIVPGVSEVTGYRSDAQYLREVS